MMLNVLDLFSGIGGFSLGLERTGGFRTVAFCEIEPFARRVLAKHWPEVPCYDDVRSLTADRLRADGISVDVICGGFPCQDISLAGNGAGLEGERSGLWFEYARIIQETHPRWVIIENVSALRSRGLDTCLRGLASIGYDAEWHCIPAAAVGAPHRRDRVWIMAYPNEIGRLGWSGNVGQTNRRNEFTDGGCVADTAGIDDRIRHAKQVLGQEPESRNGGFPLNVRDANGAGLAERQGQRGNPCQKLTAVVGTDWWITEPDVGRVADGVPSRVDRLRCLGNSVVPQIPELIGRAILAAEQSA